MAEFPSDNKLSPEGRDSSLPISPSLHQEFVTDDPRVEQGVLDLRTVFISAIAILIAFFATITAKVLIMLIALVTNLSFFGRASLSHSDPANNHLGWAVLAVPTIGGVIVGIMARYGSRAIRGHGIPEAMEQIITNQSRIPPRITFLKPTSSAVAIGTGGPFGAEGPIIATGGALGSLVGQLLRTTAIERKVLLASGAAAGMTAIFGSPIAAVILAVELLLFELRPTSIIPVALACASAAGARLIFFEAGPVFQMQAVPNPTTSALAFYVALGLIIGIASVIVTKLVYYIEDSFEKIPIHWMWYPAIGGLVVGLVGYFEPRTLGVGYSNISALVNGQFVGATVLSLCLLKFVSWAVALGSGTSGGTLAPMLTIGGGLGSLIGAAAISLLPTAGIDIRVAAVVGMAGLFGGASRALLTSIVFAFETTQQPACLLPLLGGCVAAYLVSCLLMRTTIMTEKIVRRGISVPNEYIPDHLSNISLAAVAIKPVVSIKADDTLGTVRAWLRSHRPEAEHQGYPVLNSKGRLIGVVTRRNLLNPEIEDSQLVSSTIQTAPIVIASSATLRDAADEMVRRGVGRLPIVDSRKSDALIGIITRSDLLSAHQTRIHEHEHIERTIRLRPMKRLMIRNLQRKRRLATVTIARDVAQPSETPTDKTG